MDKEEEEQSAMEVLIDCFAKETKGAHLEIIRRHCQGLNNAELVQLKGEIEMVKNTLLGFKDYTTAFLLHECYLFEGVLKSAYWVYDPDDNNFADTVRVGKCDGLGSVLVPRMSGTIFEAAKELARNLDKYKKAYLKEGE